ncbi:putative Leucyl aminopeptidase [uncultured Desulfobacterium sp.]|uniref:Aminopeptidase n=1 Tax=uncultured Desulfobacterium sp. TaxID=201089 RepID=A0A445MTE2_9BACT|nr:putative Leucyl aminopeptidase [uncultured Desulfobacterium sp.]
MHEIRPISYKLSLEPDLDEFRFSGTVEISMHADGPAEKIILDALDLSVVYCGVFIDRRFVDCRFSPEPEAEKLNVYLPEEMSGEIRIKIEYTGEINDKMAGFYRSSFNVDGTTRNIALTQFEESDARRAFPCLDHPDKKAVFEIEMIIAEGLTALSNAPVMLEEQLDNGKKRVRFEPTPRMSTYLVFFSLGEFEIIEDDEDPRIRVAAMPGMACRGRLGLDFGRKSLAFCEQLFGIPYPLAKLDLIAVQDFAFGAMENWGAITFRENLLLHFPGITSRAGEENICNVVAHEIVHQWFGNLVTPSDWKYLWLNESFATYIAHVIVDHYCPEWDVMDHFVLDQTALAFERDSLHETFSIEIPGGEHIVINASTAPIIYNKGGSVLEQIEDYLGRDDFKKGIKQFLSEHGYGCADSRHLWGAFETASQRPVTRIMKSWIEQPGYPIMDVERKGDRLEIRQRRFTFLPNQSAQLWIAPISVRLYDERGGSKTVTSLIEAETTEIELGDGTVAYKVNADQKGFYRVRYRDRTDLERLGERLKHMSPRDRWGLQNDLYALVKGAEAGIDDYLSFLLYYDDEESFLPLMSISDNLHHAWLVLKEPEKRKISSTAKSLFERVLRKIGLEPIAGERHATSILRDHILWRTAVYGSKTAEDFGVERFESLMGGGLVHQDILRAVMQIGALHGCAGAFEWFDRRFQSTQSEHERMTILAAIGCFKDDFSIQTVLDYVLDKVPSRNRFITVGAMAGNPYAIGFLWHWYVANLEALEQLHPLHYERVIASIVPVAGLGKEKSVTEFLDHYMMQKDKARDVIRLSLERLRVNSRMRAHHC